MKKFKKRFGQNFLINKKIIISFVKNLNIEQNDIIIEIGPGDGRVTFEILKQDPKKVIAIEIDRDLIEILKDKFIAFDNFKLINQDFLQLDLDSMRLKDYKVIGSLPYNISKKIIDKFLFVKTKPKLMCFILQKEVAESFISKPPKATFLSLITDVLYEKKYIRTIDSKNFYPKPKVDSAIIKFKLKDCPLINDINELKSFKKFLLNSFRSPRKMLKNVLKSIYKIEDIDKIFQELNIPLNSRAENLDTKTYIDLFKRIINYH